MNRQGKKSFATEKRHYITIQTKTKVADGEGGFTDTWTDSDSIWAAVYPMKAVQRFEYKSIDVDATHVIKVDGLVPISELNRVKFGGRYFEILTVENLKEQDFQLYIVCKEIRNG